MFYIMCESQSGEGAATGEKLCGHAVWWPFPANDEEDAVLVSKYHIVSRLGEASQREITSFFFFFLEIPWIGDFLVNCKYDLYDSNQHKPES